MKLVIREYLSMLKESGELDVLLPDLLIEMGIIPLTRPGKGTRQDGVDIPAIGIDPKDKIKKLFLLVVKCGDITRNNWDEVPNGIRPSLNEILDGYLSNRVRLEHQKIPKKIVLVTGGELKENVSQNWTNFINKNKDEGIEFDFWGGDELTLKIQKYLLDEYLFPESARKNLRKTIALADQNDNEPHYFYSLVRDILLGSKLSTEKKKSAELKRKKALHLINLSLSIVFYWCQDADNLRPSLLCAERVLLLTWDWIRQCNLLDCKKTVEGFNKLFSTYMKIGDVYILKIKTHCYARDGLFAHSSYEQLEYPLRTFEIIGILGSLGMSNYYFAYSTTDADTKQKYLEKTKEISKHLAAVIKNNPAAYSPRYDGHSIDIVLGLLTLKSVENNNFIINWVSSLCKRIINAYQLGRHFPIALDSYEQLIAMQFNQAPPKEELMNLSTILPILADWYAILDINNEYKYFQDAVTHCLASTDFQQWFPDETTDNFIYNCNAGYTSGFMISSIVLPPNLEQYKHFICQCHNNPHNKYRTLSCIKHDWPILALISSRHFRTPVIPFYWQRYISSHSSLEPNNKDDH